MDNAAFSAGDGPAERQRAADTRLELALEMKSRQEEKQPLCQCHSSRCQCVLLEESEGAEKPAVPQLRLKQWNRVKTALLASVVAALVLWCVAMAVLHHYQLL